MEDPKWVRPFEWLTSSESLKDKLDWVLQDKQQVRILHVGCGSSILGEFVVENFPNVALMVNVDCDSATLTAMQERWQTRCKADVPLCEKMQFVTADVCREMIPFEDGAFDIVLDKSTLDCLLCTDRGASSLITEIYRLLNPDDGIYWMISFHQMGLLQPLLQDCPGTNWKLSHSLMYRQVEDLVGPGRNKVTNLAQVQIPEDMMMMTSSSSSSVSFLPDEVYHRTVHVLQCHKQPTTKNNNTAISFELDREAVNRHVNQCCDQWYRQHNPMLTKQRMDQIRQAYGNDSLSISDSYHVLLTPQEKEHLSYEAFMEDWATYLERHPDLPSELMSSETAIHFLSEMQ